MNPTQDATQGKANAAAAKAALAQEQRDKAIQEAHDIVDEMLEAKPLLYWSKREDKWFERLPCRWNSFSTPSMMVPLSPHLPTKTHTAAFTDYLRGGPEGSRRLKEHTVRSFSKRWENDVTVVNLATTADWAKPVEGEPHFIFDLLLQCLAGNRVPEQEHIEQSLIWKYTHPGEYMLPALVLFGGSGTGKGLLMEHIIKTIFTIEHYVKLLHANQLKDFNETLEEAVVVLFDEAHFRDPQEEEWLKANVMNSVASVNGKGKARQNVETTIWYLIANNDELSSPVRVTGEKIDRRYSLIRTSIDFVDVLAEHLGCSAKEAADRLTTEFVPKVLNSQHEVGKWLNHLMLKYPNLESPPLAWHGEDYEAVLEHAQTLDELVLEEIFVQRNIDYISRACLYMYYQQRAAEDGIQQNRVKGKKKFDELALNWLKKKGLPFICQNKKRHKGLEPAKYGMRSGIELYIRVGFKGPYTTNDMKFLKPTAPTRYRR